jgi:hypothetical protein
MCRMEKPTREWAGSTFQVPVGMTIGAVVLLMVRS